MMLWSSVSVVFGLLFGFGGCLIMFVGLLWGLLIGLSSGEWLGFGGLIGFV